MRRRGDNSIPETNPDADHFIEAVAFINLGLLIFNMLPIYPLDGGQIVQVQNGLCGKRWESAVPIRPGSRRARRRLSFRHQQLGRMPGLTEQLADRKQECPQPEHPRPPSAAK
jgi:Peptidase family M50